MKYSVVKPNRANHSKADALGNAVAGTAVKCHNSRIGPFQAMVYYVVLGIIWFAFVAVWFIGVLTAKRTVRWSWGGVWWRVGIVASVVVLVHLLWGSPSIAGVVAVPALNIVGLVAAASGAALAIWARLYLGRNWGMPMAVKERPALVSNGPYAYIRHPIYAGILLALLGSGLIIWWWLVVFAWTLAHFVGFAVGGEEQLMLKEFPDTYPAYKARTRRLIPFMW